MLRTDCRMEAERPVRKQLAIIQEIDDGAYDQGDRNGDSEKLSDSGYVLKLESTGLLVD